MKFTLTKADHASLKLLSQRTRKTMTCLVTDALTRLFKGEIAVPTRPETVDTGLNLTQEHQTQLARLSKETGVTMEELIRTAIRQLILDMKDILESARALQERREKHMTRQEALMKRQEALMKRKEKAEKEGQTQVAVGTFNLKTVKKDENHH